MTRDASRLLEFDRLLSRIATFAHSPATLPLVEELSPLPSQADIEQRFSQVEEIRALSRNDIRVPLDYFDDITAVVELSRPAGSLLSTSELSLLIPFLRISDRVGRLLSYRNDIPMLLDATAGIRSFADILEPLEQTIAPDGNLLDTASNLLFSLRKKSRSLIGKVRKRLEEIVRERAVAIFLQDDFISQRNGRWVIPVRMDSKGMVPGVVHDISRSGETAFMEPIEIIGMVNELENLHAEEKTEEIRILKEITAWIREEADEILTSFRGVVYLDFLCSLAGFADLLGAGRPRISPCFELDIVSGYHPLLLLLSLERGNNTVVPLDLRLGGEHGKRTILITGPNTGGKTIAIKAAGLLMLMAQSGIPVPADSRSIFPATAKLAADIGDEQSIEASLSTFSAHIQKIATILHSSDEQTLVLLDELGTGTDPLQGSAIACAILQELMERRSLVLATTHLVDIVAFVQKSPDMVNAAMEFDRRSLSPLYRLTTGQPGQSHALDIARRCGLPDRIITMAEGFAGRMESEFHALLSDLRKSASENSKRQNELLHREKELLAKTEQLETAKLDIESIRRKAKEHGLLEAKALINAARGELNRILEEARKDKSRKSVSQLASMEALIDKDLEEIAPRRQLNPATLTAGSTVHVKTLGSNATVVTIDNRHERLRVHAGSIEFEVPFSAVTIADDTPQKPKSVKKKMLRPDNEAPYELNLIGMRLDESLLLLQKFLDTSALNGLSEVRIIHGIGTGTLMKGVREELARSPHIASFRAGQGIEGGEGVTVAKISG